MDVSLNWLKEYAPFDCDIKTFAEDMTMSGSKVEVYSTEKDKIRNVVVGKVVSLDKHPNADKLTVCTIDVGTEQIIIVTGAKNLTVGDLVPVALDNSLLPCGKEIHAFGESKLEAVAEELGVPVLARLPIDPATAALVDKGAVELADDKYVADAVDFLTKMQ